MTYFFLKTCISFVHWAHTTTLTSLSFLGAFPLLPHLLFSNGWIISLFASSSLVKYFMLDFVGYTLKNVLFCLSSEINDFCFVKKLLDSVKFVVFFLFASACLFLYFYYFQFCVLTLVKDIVLTSMAQPFEI